MLTGFGAVKTRLRLGVTSPAPPARTCVGAAGTRTFTLASDPKSILRLSVKGAACGSHAWGTFKVTSGSGVFTRATGSGVIIGTLTGTNPLRESLRYSGVITLARK